MNHHSINYLRVDNHKQAVIHIWESRWFKSMYTLQVKPDQHATHIPRSVRIWHSTIRISRGPRIATFHVAINRVKQIHCSQERGLSTTSLAQRLIDPRVSTQFHSPHNHWSSSLKPNIGWWPATSVYWAHNSSMWSVRSIVARKGQPIGS
jgi:hypothetical protein